MFGRQRRRRLQHWCPMCPASCLASRSVLVTSLVPPWHPLMISFTPPPCAAGCSCMLFGAPCPPVSCAAWSLFLVELRRLHACHLPGLFMRFLRIDIERMKVMCGPQYTKKLEDMYYDLGMSEDASKVGGSVTAEGDQCSAMHWVNGCADGVLVMGVVIVVQRCARRPRLVTCLPSTCVVFTPWGPVPPGAAVCSALRGGTEGWHRPPARRQLPCVCAEDLLLARHEHVRDSW